MKNSWLVTAAVAALGLAASLLFALLPAERSTAQVNADGCTCSRATASGSGREQLATYHCVCPGIQCVITATQAGANVPPNVVQNCK